MKRNEFTNVYNSKKLVRKILNVFMEHFDSDNVIMDSSNEYFQMAMYADDHKNRLIYVDIDTVNDTMNFGVVFYKKHINKIEEYFINDNYVEIYSCIMNNNGTVTKFDPITSDVPLPSELINSIRDVLRNTSSLNKNEYDPDKRINH